MISDQAVRQQFESGFGRSPHGIAFAPGRVNLIGEHIDYHGYSVMPAALELGVSVAWASRKDRKIVARTLSTLRGREHSTAEFDLDAIGPAVEGGTWSNYVRAAAAMAIAEAESAQEVDHGVDHGVDQCGMDLLVASDLPEASGLSSSSALIVASGLALMDAAGSLGDLTDLRRLELAADFASAERYVGTAGGGMDQAASLGGQAGAVLKIDFDPLRWTRIPFPSGIALLIAHTGVRAEKSGEAMLRYNEIRHAKRDPDVEAHIQSEAERVEKFEIALRSGHMKECGRLMNASHESLKGRLRVSHPALDALVEAARSAGCLGARMTGAGFGGSIVALAHEEQAQTALAALQTAQQTLPDAHPAFVAKPGHGASVTRVRQAD